jgi:DNA-directed RNA polymerase specialized sigma24 family protein
MPPMYGMTVRHVTLDPASWVDKYGNVLYRYALTRLRNPATAEDAVQETFLAAMKSRESCRTPLTGSFRYDSGWECVCTS